MSPLIYSALASSLEASVSARTSIADSGAVAARVGPPEPRSRRAIDRDPVRVSRQLLPRRPAVHSMTAALELRERRRRKARLHVQEITRVADDVAPGQPPRRPHGLLDIHAEVDHGCVSLEVDLGLAVGAHAAEHLPEGVALEGERSDQGVKRDLAGL